MAADACAPALFTKRSAPGSSSSWHRGFWEGGGAVCFLRAAFMLLQVPHVSYKLYLTLHYRVREDHHKGKMNKEGRGSSVQPA